MHQHQAKLCLQWVVQQWWCTFDNRSANALHRAKLCCPLLQMKCRGEHCSTGAEPLLLRPEKHKAADCAESFWVSSSPPDAAELPGTALRHPSGQMTKSRCCCCLGAAPSAEAWWLPRDSSAGIWPAFRGPLAMLNLALNMFSKHLPVNSTQPTAANARWRHLAVLQFTSNPGQVCSTKLACAHITQQQMLSTSNSQRPL